MLVVFLLLGGGGGGVQGKLHLECYYASCITPTAILDQLLRSPVCCGVYPSASLGNTDIASALKKPKASVIAN